MLFSNFEELKSRFSYCSILPKRGINEGFQVLGGQESRIELKKRQKLHFRVFDTSNMPIGNTNIHIQINVSEFIMNLSFIPVNLIVKGAEITAKLSF